MSGPAPAPLQPPRHLTQAIEPSEVASAALPLAPDEKESQSFQSAPTQMVKSPFALEAGAAGSAALLGFSPHPAVDGAEEEVWRQPAAPERDAMDDGGARDPSDAQTAGLALPSTESEGYTWTMPVQTAAADPAEQEPTYSENPDHHKTLAHHPAAEPQSEGHAEKDVQVETGPAHHEWSFQPPQYQPPLQDSARSAAPWGDPDSDEILTPGVENYPWQSIPRAE
ncbi:hypothetical protein EH165_11190 [Nakamurella antarctica]|uniref:Uncharacterized protein n=1 Tax=Nakamurella antarctica TaxID=1902245 RepID=A0A3G8ZMY2_9ACTN|nr:hypothetical protein [Nakamurella antarctica]AZI58613.1 hypothetical protein EH165_11190 [Nakamurella antarctica]